MTDQPDTAACEWCGRAIAQDADSRWYAVKGKERGYDPLTCDASDDGRHDGPDATALLPEAVRGDGPCADCGGLNIVWFTDNVLWNQVVRQRGPECILCIHCFVARADKAGLDPVAWRLLAEWPERLVEAPNGT